MPYLAKAEKPPKPSKLLGGTIDTNHHVYHIDTFVFWHILLYPFLTVVDGFVYRFAWADCPCCYTIVLFHCLDLGSKRKIWYPIDRVFILKTCQPC